MYNNHKVAVIIPAYRVEKSIAKVILGIPDYIDQIIVVDDCSPDSSSQIVNNIQDSRIRLIRHKVNMGVGGAMKTGFQEAMNLGMDIMVKMDGDNQMNPQYLPALLYPLTKRECDYIKGNRFSFLEKKTSMPLIRKIGSQALTFLNKMASGYWHIFDPQNGYLAIRADALRKINLDWIDNTYFFENSMLINLNVIEAKASDVYIPAVYGDEESSMSIAWVLRKFPFKLIKGFCFRIFYRYIYRDISPVSILLFLGTFLFTGGIIFGFIVWYRSVFYQHPMAIGTLALGLIPLMFGFQMLMNALLMDIQQSPSGTQKIYDFSFNELKHLHTFTNQEKST